LANRKFKNGAVLPMALQAHLRNLGLIISVRSKILSTKTEAPTCQVRPMYVTQPMVGIQFFPNFVTYKDGVFKWFVNHFPA
jgi:hypothetical protein